MPTTSLKTWFTIHFIVDYIIGLPLLLAPTLTLSLFSLPAEPISARLVGAALLGIGGISLIHKPTKDSYLTLLKLKLIWSSSALLGLLLALYETKLVALWLFIVTFVFFFCVWLYYYRKIQN